MGPMGHMGIPNIDSSLQQVSTNANKHFSVKALQRDRNGHIVVVFVVKNKTAIISFGRGVFIDGETTYCH